MLEKLHTLYPSMLCTGVEIESHLVAIAESNVAEKNLSRCKIFKQSVTALEFPENSFDFVICRLVLEHLPDPLLALKEVLRTLKTGGKAVFVDNDFDLHERTFPDSPALDELYNAYRNARRSDGGNPCIGRELPSLLKQAGYESIDLHLLAAHSQIVGDAAFLKAEGAGIPAQLVKTGYLTASAFERVASQWRSMLDSGTHAIFRMLFAAVGEKRRVGRAEIVAASGGSARPGSLAKTDFLDISIKQSPEKICRFIQSALSEEIKVPADDIPINQSLIRLGVDSMAAMGLRGQIAKHFAVTISIADILGDATIEDIVRKIAVLEKSAAPVQGIKMASESSTEPIRETCSPLVC